MLHETECAHKGDLKWVQMFEHFRKRNVTVIVECLVPYSNRVLKNDMCSREADKADPALEAFANCM